MVFEQWGIIGAEKTLTFPIAMTNNNYSINTSFGTTNVDIGKTGHWFGLTKQLTGVTRSYANLESFWFVIGY